jgi:uncharacterized protein YaiE (UPF0345 family)
MSVFNEVMVTREANVYYEGNVSSRTIAFADGSCKTLGFMLAGDYRFETVMAEGMEVLGGSARVKLPGSDAWVVYEPGMSFEVPAASAFELEVDAYLDYCCSYLES